MTKMTRRAALLALGALPLAACSNGVGSSGAAKIDARVNATLNELYTRYPDTLNLADVAAGILVMPVVTEAGLGVGGSYARGALLVGGSTVDYYSAETTTSLSPVIAVIFGHAGLRIGATLDGVKYTRIVP